MPIASAVLVPIYRDRAGDLQVVLVVRAEHGVHGGQIALPGGVRAETDASLRDTALREAEEEVGLPRTAVEVIDTLPEVLVPTGFLITPFLARLLVEPPVWRLQEREITEVLTVAVRDLAREDLQGEELWARPLWPAPLRVRFVRLGPHKLWGATYRILEPLVPRLLAGEWEIHRA
ncbi:MAG TPA: CoA pyrophosphatase [Candidatus Acidoferrales bacterium]|nr:CoA pyrophosphatase [Candidatus Acidoferrales bacterium]